MSRHSARAARRLPVLVLVPAALIAGGLADRAGGPARLSGSAAVQPVPVAAPIAAYSSSWFCAGAADSFESSPADAPSGHVVVYDLTGRPETATVQIVTTAGAPVTDLVSVPAHGSAVVGETVSGGAAWAGAVVDVDGSSAVEEVLTGLLGTVVGQCATSGSPDWYLPSGQTRVNADETVLLLNPFPTASIVDLSFTTNAGQEQPQDFESVEVPSEQLVAIDLGSHLRRRSAIATTVHARSGRIVAWSEEVVTPPTNGESILGTPAASAPLADPAAPISGVVLALGAPSTGTSWEWPDGLAGNGVDEQYLVYNPGAQTADVSLAIGLSEGAAEPFSLTVGPGQVVPVVSEESPRIPAGSPHSALLTSTNGVPVVATRTVVADDPDAQYIGTGAILGERVPAVDWVVPFSATDSNHRGQVVIVNAGQQPALVTVTRAGASPVTETVAPGHRASVPVGSTTAGTVSLHSNSPVYVEYDLFADGGNAGYSIGSAIPLAGS